MNKKPVLVIGAGAAGLLAAISAGRQGADVCLLEKGSRAGRKILVSGSARCNLTNQAPLDLFIEQYHGQGKFLYPSFRRFFRPQLLDLLADGGLLTKAEPNGKVFPASDRALDVVNTLLQLVQLAGADILLQQAAVHVQPRPDASLTVRTQDSTFSAAAVIIATGGLSWPQTGSTGDGYRIARTLGHSLATCRPGLAGIVLAGTKTQPLQGIACSQTAVTLLRDGQKIADSRGDLLWTHFGLSGPAVLRLSRYLEYPDQNDARQPRPQALTIDFLPETGSTELNQTLAVLARDTGRRQIQTILARATGLPQALAFFLAGQAQLDPRQQAATCSRRQLEELSAQVKNLTLTVHGSRGYREAMVTAGGVRLSDVDPRSLQSKRVPNLFFAGEVLDLDGDTGGYNLQAAFSTGWLAGEKAAVSCSKQG